ncbi:hypothetical protein BC937DRAFT_94264 [Endogone sp. FLAS-F59071]|nr:hypothetical protein BC937DRAFT_94264 [Endogone sp. FLAS-F59071]|eukprot:RUS14156.1 hypothetical protein BC937DRAFT_94264 [Endogone sp. FLAS-F59071]
MGEAKRKKWSVNSTILPRERPNFYFVDPADQQKNVALLNNIVEGKYVLMHGARASGKSTRTWRVMEQLQEFGYFCLYISLSHVNLLRDPETFWQSFGATLKENLEDCFGPRGSLQIDTTVPDVNTSDDFRRICLRQNELWYLLALKRKEKGQPNFIENRFLVIFIDEFDALVNIRDSSIRDSFLGMIHGIKTSGDIFAVQSIVGVGTFNILTLNTESRALSPFNISDVFKNPNFTPEQVTTLFKEFVTEYRLAIPDDVIQDICLNTNGHAGLVNLCGRAIESYTQEHAHTLKGQLSYERWKLYSGEPLGQKIAEYRTFDKMIKSLSKDSSRKANDILRSYFLGYQDVVRLTNQNDIACANILVSEGVLISIESQTNSFKMSSPLVDSIIRQRVLPLLDTHAPKTAPIKLENGAFNIWNLVATATSYFNKNILRNAVYRSFKLVGSGKVENRTHCEVPRESVYQSELARILILWIVDMYALEVTTQWYVVYENAPGSVLQHKYCDIIITSPNNCEQPMVLLELLASGTEGELREHFKRTLKYATKFDNPEVWVVNYTCLDGATVTPVWQSDAELCQGLNVMHVRHNLDFTEMRIAYRCYKNGRILRDKDGMLVDKNNHVLASQDIQILMQLDLPVRF